MPRSAAVFALLGLASLTCPTSVECRRKLYLTAEALLNRTRAREEQHQHSLGADGFTIPQQADSGSLADVHEHVQERVPLASRAHTSNDTKASRHQQVLRSQGPYQVLRSVGVREIGQRAYSVLADIAESPMQVAGLLFVFVAFFVTSQVLFVHWPGKALSQQRG